MTRFNFSRKTKILIPIIIFIVSFVFVDFLAGYFYAKKIRLYRKANFFYHQELVRNISNLNVLWGKEYYKISTNSLGFRDKNNREIPLKNDIYRIILMGDSFTESVGVNWENSFPGILSENLNFNKSSKKN